MRYRKGHNLKRADAHVHRAAKAELRLRSNNRRQPCLSYVAGAIRLIGTPVVYAKRTDSVANSSRENHQELCLQGLLKFRDFDCALTSLQKIDALYRGYREVSDRVGTSLARELVTRGERRARGMVANTRLSPEKRREKQEIAQWFKVWLEVPDLFFDWLEMRQKSEEFQTLFPRANGQSWRHEGRRSFSV